MAATVNTKTYYIVVCGGLNWDMISVGHRLPEAGETYNSLSFVQTPGGKGANTAIACHRLSHREKGEADDVPPSVSPDYDIKVRMIGSVGDKTIDSGFGEQMIESLGRHFVDTENVVRQSGVHSAVAVTWVEEDSGQNRILVFPGANHKLGEEAFKDKGAFGDPQPDLVVSQLELDPETVFQLLTTAKEAKIDTLLNPSPGLYIESVVFNGLTHLILNESEASIMADKELTELEKEDFDWNEVTNLFLRDGVKYVVVTLGIRGAFFSTKVDEGEYVPAEYVPVEETKDTSGAGYVQSTSLQANYKNMILTNNSDTFVGAYAVDYVTRDPKVAWDIRKAVQFACRAAARTIQEVGCQDTIPWASQLSDSSDVRL